MIIWIILGVFAGFVIGFIIASALGSARVFEENEEFVEYFTKRIEEMKKTHPEGDAEDEEKKIS